MVRSTVASTISGAADKLLGSSNYLARNDTRQLQNAAIRQQMSREGDLALMDDVETLGDYRIDPTSTEGQLFQYDFIKLYEDNPDVALRALNSDPRFNEATDERGRRIETKVSGVLKNEDGSYSLTVTRPDGREVPVTEGRSAQGDDVVAKFSPEDFQKIGSKRLSRIRGADGAATFYRDMGLLTDEMVANQAMDVVGDTVDDPAERSSLAALISTADSNNLRAIAADLGVDVGAVEAQVADANPQVAPNSLYAAIEQVESGGDPDAVSSAGAVGRMQTMPATLKDPGFGIEPAKDDSDAERTRVGRQYIDAMLKKYGGNMEHALAAYNWGPANVDKWIADGADMSKLPQETQDYLPKVMAQMQSTDGAPASTSATQQQAAPQPTTTPVADGPEYIRDDPGVERYLWDSDRMKSVDNAISNYEEGRLKEGSIKNGMVEGFRRKRDQLRQRISTVEERRARTSTKVDPSKDGLTRQRAMLEKIDGFLVKEGYGDDQSAPAQPANQTAQQDDQAPNELEKQGVPTAQPIDTDEQLRQAITDQIAVSPEQESIVRGYLEQEGIQRPQDIAKLPRKQAHMVAWLAASRTPGTTEQKLKVADQFLNYLGTGSLTTSPNTAANTDLRRAEYLRGVRNDYRDQLQLLGEESDEAITDLQEIHELAVDPEGEGFSTDPAVLSKLTPKVTAFWNRASNALDPKQQAAFGALAMEALLTDMSVRMTQGSPGWTDIQGQIDDFKNDNGNVRVGKNGLAGLLRPDYKTRDGEKVLTGFLFSDPSKSGGKWNFTVPVYKLRDAYGADVISGLERLAANNARRSNASDG